MGARNGTGTCLTWCNAITAQSKHPPRSALIASCTLSIWNLIWCCTSKAPRTLAAITLPSHTLYPSTPKQFHMEVKKKVKITHPCRYIGYTCLSKLATYSARASKLKSRRHVIAEPACHGFLHINTPPPHYIRSPLHTVHPKHLMLYICLPVDRPPYPDGGDSCIQLSPKSVLSAPLPVSSAPLATVALLPQSHGKCKPAFILLIQPIYIISTS